MEGSSIIGSAESAYITAKPIDYLVKTVRPVLRS